MSAKHAHRSRRRLTGPLIAVLAVAATVTVSGLSSAALLQDRADVPANAFTSGTVDISTGATTAFSVPGMMPGDAITAPLTTINQGTASLRYAMLSTTTENTVASAVTMTVRAQSPGDTSCTAFDGITLYTGPLGSTGRLPILGDATTGAQVGDRVLDVGQRDDFCIRLSLPLSTGNEVALQTTTATFDFAAEQTRNNGPVYVAPTVSGSTFVDIGGGVPSGTITVPAGVASTDLAVLVTATDGGPGPSSPSPDWITRVSNPAGQNNSYVSVFTRLGGSRPGDTVTLTRPGNSVTQVAVIWYRTAGRDVTVVGAPGTRSGVSQFTTTIPGITTTHAGTDVLVVATERTLAGGTTITSWDPMAPVQDFFREAQTASSSTFLGHFTQPEAGSTGPLTATYTTNAGNAVAVLLALGQTGTTP
jgi:hypothetical protein